MRFRPETDNRQQPPVYEGNGETIQTGQSGVRNETNQVGFRPAFQQNGRRQIHQPMGRTQELMEQLRSYDNNSYYAQQPDMQDPYGYQERYYMIPDDEDLEQQNKKKRKKKKKHSFLFLWIVISLLCLAGIAFLALMVLPQVLGVQIGGLKHIAFVNGNIIAYDPAVYADHYTYRQYMDSSTIFPGVYIDEIHVGGMTKEQATEAVRQAAQVNQIDFSITIQIGNGSWIIDNGSVQRTRNVVDVVNRAWAYGRENSTSIRGTGVTPFQERLNTALALRSEPVSLHTEETYDFSAIRGQTQAIADFVNRDPVNSMVATFDFNTCSFTFTDDQSGAYVDAEEMYQKVLDTLNAGTYYTTLTFYPQEILAPVTKAELRNSFGLISSYTTETTNNANRNTNIELAAKAISGMTVLPGETFSFNAATGERLESKGYKQAAAISGGATVDEVGGGVCQVSSTLFNAVARANLEIVYRSPHAWPSSYVEKGMDATVDWPNLDFKWKNNTDWPVFIIANYAKRKVTVQLYGMGLGDGITIDLKSEVVQTIEPSDDTKFVQNTSLPAGTSKTTVRKRTGYIVDTYKIWYQNGTQIRREKLCSSTYKAYQQTVEWN